MDSDLSEFSERVTIGGLGRSTKLDDLCAKRIIDALRAGHSFGGAARAGGIEERTLHKWRERGADGDGVYAQFVQRVNQACQVAEDRCVQVIKNAMEGPDKRLATDTAWRWLQRRRVAEWGDGKALDAKPGESDDAQSLEFARSVVAALESKTGTDD